jgi:hypothetical protein
MPVRHEQPTRKDGLGSPFNICQKETGRWLAGPMPLRMCRGLTSASSGAAGQLGGSPLPPTGKVVEAAPQGDLALRGRRTEERHVARRRCPNTCESC